MAENGPVADSPVSAVDMPKADFPLTTHLQTFSEHIAYVVQAQDTAFSDTLQGFPASE
jgi:hypothetical protein